jgi:hypothetical protein
VQIKVPDEASVAEFSINARERRKVVARTIRSFGLLLVLALAAVTGICGLAASSLADNSASVREFEINGTKLYVPTGWLIEISGEDRSIEEVRHQYLKPGEPAPSQFGSPAKLEYMVITFCRPQVVPNPTATSGEKREWQLKRLFVAEEIPQDWCVGRVSLDGGPKGLASNPRLGVRTLKNEFVSKNFGPENKWGFKLRQGENMGRSVGEGTYLGMLAKDISRSGGPVALDAYRSPDGSDFFHLSMPTLDAFQIAIDGINARYFEWFVPGINPGQFRLIFGRSQSLLDWLSTLPIERSKIIPSNE